jgi:hypothetical protein
MGVPAPGRTRLECLALGKKAPDVVSLQLPWVGWCHVGLLGQNLSCTSRPCKTKSERQSLLPNKVFVGGVESSLSSKPFPDLSLGHGNSPPSVSPFLFNSSSHLHLLILVLLPLSSLSGLPSIIIIGTIINLISSVLRLYGKLGLIPFCCWLSWGVCAALFSFFLPAC